MTIVQNGTTDDIASRTIAMERVFASSLEQVWDALTDPARVKLWYGGAGFSNLLCEMDVRVGGRWLHVMRTPDGTDHDLEFEFTLVEPPHLLAWRDARSPHGPLNMVRLEAVAGGTLMRFGARFATLDDRRDADGYGFSVILGQGFDRMGSVLAMEESL